MSYRVLYLSSLNEFDTVARGCHQISPSLNTSILLNSLFLKLHDPQTTFIANQDLYDR